MAEEGRRQPIPRESCLPAVPEEFAGLTVGEGLAKLAETAEPEENRFLNRRRAELFGKRAAAAKGEERLKWRFQEGQEWLLAGETEKSLEIMGELKAALEGPEAGEKAAPLRRQVWQMLAVGLLRLGEQQNCLQQHQCESCILPIRESGQHELEEGSRGAITVYAAILKQLPDNLEARWLLNLAYMTLGEYPDEVPEEFLIPGLDEAEMPDFPRFMDRAGEWKLDVLANAGGCCAEDFDGDGDMDLFVTSMGLMDPCHLFRNNGDGTFDDVTEAAGLKDVTGGLNCVQADYDNDGLADLLVLRGAWLAPHGNHPNTLLRNLGELKFEDVTADAGVLSYRPTQTAAWADFDQDGWLDLFIGNESVAEAVHPGEFFHNQKDGTFREIAAEVGLDARDYVKGAVAGDYNGDGYPDLYLSLRDGPNRLYRNSGPEAEGGWWFEDVAEPAGVTEPRQSFPAWFWDFNNDGNEDLFVAGYDLKRSGRQGQDYAAELLGKPAECELPRLYENHGDGTFADVTEVRDLARVMYAMGANHGDLDNDGYEDFYAGTGAPDFRTIVPNRMFWNRGGDVFKEVTLAGGFGHLQKGHGVAFADFDNDGDQDIYAVMGGFFEGDIYQNVLFENPGNENHWLTLVLEGETANRLAVGAKVKITVSDEDEIRHDIFRTAGTGGSFGGNSLWVEVGVGDAMAVEAVEVTWPIQGWPVTKYTNLPLNSRIRLKQGQPDWEKWPVAKASRD